MALAVAGCPRKLGKVLGFSCSASQAAFQAIRKEASLGGGGGGHYLESSPWALISCSPPVVGSKKLCDSWLGFLVLFASWRLISLVQKLRSRLGVEVTSRKWLREDRSGRAVLRGKQLVIQPPSLLSCQC